MLDGRHRDAGEMGQLAAELVVLDGGSHDGAAAMDPQQCGCPVGQAGRTMQADLDVFVDRDHRYIAQPAGVAEKPHDGPLGLIAAMQRVAPGQKAGHVT